MRRLFFSLALLLFSAVLIAQQSLDNQAVVKLAKAGLSDDLIVATINGSPGNYATTADDLIALKVAGLSDKVIGAILLKSSAPTAPLSAAVSSPSPAAATGLLTSVPPEVDSVGLYYQDDKGHWQELPAEVVNFKTGGALKNMASVGLIKGDMNGHIAGNRSKLTLKLPASFILYVPEGRAPGEYQLLRLRLNSNYREFRSVTGGVVHVTSGAARDSVDCTPKKIAPRIYQVTLPSEIGAGEYGFLPPLDTVSEKNMASSGKIYTFSLMQ